MYICIYREGYIQIYTYIYMHIYLYIDRYPCRGPSHAAAENCAALEVSPGAKAPGSCPPQIRLC